MRKIFAILTICALSVFGARSDNDDDNDQVDLIRDPFERLEDGQIGNIMSHLSRDEFSNFRSASKHAHMVMQRNKQWKWIKQYGKDAAYIQFMFYMYNRQFDQESNLIRGQLVAEATNKHRLCLIAMGFRDVKTIEEMMMRRNDRPAVIRALEYTVKRMQLYGTRYAWTADVLNMLQLPDLRIRPVVERYAELKEQLEELVDAESFPITRQLLTEVIGMESPGGSLELLERVLQTTTNIQLAGLLFDYGIDFFSVVQFASGRAASSGNLELLKLMFNYGDVYTVGTTALIRAASHGQLEIVKYLIANGANVNGFDYDRKNALSSAVNYDIAKMLIDHGANVNAVGAEGWTALMSAIVREREEVVHLLIASGADVNAANERRSTALHCAVYKGDLETVQLLISKGAKVNVANDNGKSPLMDALGRGHSEIARLLLRSGADVNAVDAYWARTVLMHAEDVDNELYAELIEKGANVNGADKQGRTVLMQVEGVEKAQMLVANGAEINAADTSGRTALMEHAVQGRREIVKLLLENGVDIDAEDSYGKTAKTLAGRHKDIARMIDEHNG